MNILLARVLRKAQQFSLFGARQDPEQPGVRGGRYYRTETGHVKYGEKPTVLAGPKTQNERMWEAGAVSSFMQQGMDPKQATAAARRQRDEQEALAVQFEKEKREGWGPTKPPTPRPVGWQPKTDAGKAWKAKVEAGMRQHLGERAASAWIDRVGKATVIVRFDDGLPMTRPDETDFHVTDLGVYEENPEYEPVHAAATVEKMDAAALAMKPKPVPDVDVAREAKLKEFEADIPVEVARAAHAFSSFVPERRGDQERRGYAETLLTDWATLNKYAETPEKKQILATEFEAYRQGYRGRFIARLHAASRTASVMITGASNFPTERNRKRLNTEHKRLEELLDYRKHMLNKIRRALQPELAPIKATDPEATKKLETKATGIEGLRDELKALNRAYRKAGKPKDPKAMATIMEGASEEAKKVVMRYLSTPSPWWDDLVPAFAITNMTGQVRAAKQRTQAVARETQAREQESTMLAEGPGWKATAEPDDDRIHLKFDKKTSREVFSMLRQYGWLWSPTRSSFVRNLNEAGRSAVTQTAERLKGMPSSA